MIREEIFCLIAEERERQDRIHPEWWNSEAIGVLAEEFGEVAKAWNEQDMESLREELVHVAAVAVRWLENLEKGDQ